MEGICVHFLDQVQFFRFLKDVAMATNKVEKISLFYGPIYFVALPFGKGLQYRNSDFKGYIE